LSGFVMRKGLATAYHELSVMMDAGLPVVRALDTAGKGFRGRVARVFAGVRDGVQHGQTISEAMESQKFFPRMDLMTIRAAENSGDLGECFAMLSHWHESTYRLKRRAQGRVAWPLLTIHVAVLVVCLLGAVGTGDLSDLWMVPVRALRILLFLLYIPVGVIYAIIRYTPETGWGRRILSYIALWIPGLGGAVKRLALARYCRTFYLLYKAGVPMVETARQAPTVMGNVVVADLVRGGGDSAAAGHDVSEGFRPGLPYEFVQLWKVGEESGELEKVTKKLGDLFTDSGEFRLQQFAFWFPMTIYLIVLIVGAILVIYLYSSMIYGAIGAFG